MLVPVDRGGQVKGYVKRGERGEGRGEKEGGERGEGRGERGEGRGKGRRERWRR